MSGKLKKVTIVRSKETDMIVVASSKDEHYKVIGNQVIGFANSWSFDSMVTFTYTLQAGDAAILGVSNDTEELLRVITELDGDDVEKLRNIMEVSGLISKEV
jgi:hypothetical protein